MCRTTGIPGRNTLGSQGSNTWDTLGFQGSISGTHWGLKGQYVGRTGVSRVHIWDVLRSQGSIPATHWDLKGQYLGHTEVSRVHIWFVCQRPALRQMACHWRVRDGYHNCLGRVHFHAKSLVACNLKCIDTEVRTSPYLERTGV